MKKYLSNLDILMDLFKVSGKELANNLNVDPSLISKWRTHKRDLSPHYNYIEKISEFFIRKDSSPNNIFLISFLKKKGFLKEDNNKNIKTVLCLWLSDHLDISANEKLQSSFLKSCDKETIQISVLMGKKNRRIAVEEFLDYGGKLQFADILLLSQESIDWLSEDKEFLKRWQEKLMFLIKKDNHIKIIHWINRDSSNLIDVVYRWLPLHLTGKLESYFYPKYYNPVVRNSIFIIKDHIALVGSGGDGIDNIQTAYFDDLQNLKLYERLYHNFLKDCKPFVIIHEISKRESTLSLLCSKTISNDTLVISRIPMLPLNNIPFRCICDFKSIESSYRNNYIKKETLLALLQQLKENTNYELALPPVFSWQDHPIHLFIQKNHFVMAWENSLFPYFALAEEGMISNAFYNYFDLLWLEIPSLYRNKAYVIDSINNIISCI